MVPTHRFTTEIAAPVETCFDLSRRIDLHVESMLASRERAVGGVTDVVDVRMGLGPVGPVADVFAAAYLGRLLRIRNVAIRARAER